MTTPMKTFGPATRVALDPKHRNLSPVLSSNWERADHRLLVLIERPDPEDVQQKRLMSPSHGSGRDTVVNATTNSINGLIKWALTENPEASDSHAFGVALFSSATWDSLVEELKPTKVLLSGFKSTAHIFPDKPTMIYTHGNPVKKNGILYCTTLPIDQLLYKKDDENGAGEDTDAARSDLLYCVCRALSNLIVGRNPESLKHIVPKPIVVGTMDKFYELLDLLKANKTYACDLETANLSSYCNKVFTAQFAFSSDEGYMLPIQHPNSPFTDEEQLEIRKELRKLIADPRLPYGKKLIIYFNGKFDMRVLRAYFRVPLIPHDVWEIQAAEHLLDENMGLLDNLSFRGAADSNIKIRAGNLRNMFCLYGNDKFYTMPFSKEQRDTISAVDIMQNVDAQNYTVLDVQSIWGMRQSQLARAKRTKIFVNDEWVSFYKYFVRHCIYQMGVTAKTLSTMEEYGSYVDPDYIVELQDPKVSKLAPLLRELKEKLLDMQTVKDAEKIIDPQSGKSLFSLSKGVSVFKIKPLHLAVLFFDVMGLRPLRRTATGKPSADKEFLDANRDKYTEAEVLAEYSEGNKLLSTYVGSWAKSIESDLDGALDGCLRPSFGFWQVVTGRLSSFDPNLQNVPSRGKLAKLIKRMFIAPAGYLLPRWDFSAHEVRMWGNLSFDKNVCASFLAGLALRRQLIKNPTDEIRTRLKKEGDFHILNVFRFFRKWIEKSDQLRDAIKQIVFGVIYGKSARTLGIDLQNKKVGDLKKAIAALSKLLKAAPDKAGAIKLAALEAELDIAMDLDPFVTEAAEILAKMEVDMSAGMGWLTTMKNIVTKTGQVISGIGRPRRLFRVLTGINKSLGDAGRRAKNAPVQGISSEVGVLAGYLSFEACVNYSRRPSVKAVAPKTNLVSKLTRLVHDAQYYCTPYHLVVPQLQMGLWCSTTGAAEYYEEHFDFKMLAAPEVELEICAREDKAYKWDFVIDNLFDIILKSLVDQKELGRLNGEVQDAMNQIFWCWRDKGEREYLFEHYPFLDVPLEGGVENQIIAALKKYKIARIPLDV